MEIYNVIQKQFVANSFFNTEIKKRVKENHKPFKEIYIHLWHKRNKAMVLTYWHIGKRIVE